MILTVHYSSKFKKDLKQLQKWNEGIEQLNSVLKLLKNSERLPENYRDHKLRGNMHIIENAISNPIFC